MGLLRRARPRKKNKNWASENLNKVILTEDDLICFGREKYEGGGCLGRISDFESRLTSKWSSLKITLLEA
jgi:hypothetical protein